MKVNHSIGTWFVVNYTPESRKLFFMQQNSSFIMKVNHSIDTWFLLSHQRVTDCCYATEVRFQDWFTVSILLVDYINLLEIQSTWCSDVQWYAVVTL